MYLRFLSSLALLFLVAACAENAPTTPEAEPATTTEETSPTANDWQILFDGTSTEGWRGYNQDSLPANWVIDNGTLKSLGTGGDIGGDIVYGKQPYGEFELSLSWKIADGGNSGIFYHVLEGDQYHAPYENAPEYQLIDDLNFPDPLEDWQQVGADYAMYPADPAKKQVKPAGEWNTSRIVYTNEQVEYWLNGQQVVSFNPQSEDWKTRRNSGKWDDYPDYAKSSTGLIGLQDHGSEIWFKEIKIREL